MWGQICTESSYQLNFNFGFSTHKSDILLHLSQWQYWWWFWFAFFWTFYYFIIFRTVKNRITKMNLKINTSLRGRGKWGDFLIALLPLSWCANILLNSNFILRMYEWQNESSLFTVRIHGKQWYWIYKFDLIDAINILTVPKNIGDNRWVFGTPQEIIVCESYLQTIQLRAKADWIKTYWRGRIEDDFKTFKNIELDSNYFFKKNKKENFFFLNNSKITNSYINSKIPTLLPFFKTKNTTLSILNNFNFQNFEPNKLFTKFKHNFKYNNIINTLKYDFYSNKNYLKNISNISDIFKDLNSFKTNFINEQINNLKKKMDLIINFLKKKILIKQPTIKQYVEYPVEQIVEQPVKCDFFFNRYNQLNNEIINKKGEEFRNFLHNFNKTQINNYSNTKFNEFFINIYTLLDDFNENGSFTNSDLFFKNFNKEKIKIDLTFFLKNFDKDGMFTNMLNSLKKFNKNYELNKKILFPDLENYKLNKKNLFSDLEDYELNKKNIFSDLYNFKKIQSNRKYILDLNLHIAEIIDKDEDINFTFRKKKINPYFKKYLNKEFISFNLFNFNKSKKTTDIINKSDLNDSINFTFKKKKINPFFKKFLNKEFVPFNLFKFNNVQTNSYYDYEELDDTWDTTNNIKHQVNVGPIRLIKHLLTQDFFKTNTDLLKFDFYENNNQTSIKIPNTEDFWVLKQKRYKKKQIIKSASLKNNEYSDFETIRNIYKKHIIENLKLITDLDFKMDPYTLYKCIKGNRHRTETLPVHLYRRLLRTKRTLVLPVHINMTIVTNSYDVVHSWFLPGLGIKMDCVPGRSTHHSLYLDNIGFYYGQCAEICGRYHHHMPIRLCALPFEHFLVWWELKALPKILKLKKKNNFVEYNTFKYTW